MGPPTCWEPSASPSPGAAARKELPAARFATIRHLPEPLCPPGRDTLDALLRNLLVLLDTTSLDRCTLRRPCDHRVCTDCPIPADEFVTVAGRDR